jgi:hypothetical protein
VCVCVCVCACVRVCVHVCVCYGRRGCTTRMRASLWVSAGHSTDVRQPTDTPCQVCAAELFVSCAGQTRLAEQGWVATISRLIVCRLVRGRATHKKKRMGKGSPPGPLLTPRADHDEVTRNGHRAPDLSESHRSAWEGALFRESENVPQLYFGLRGRQSNRGSEWLWRGCPQAASRESHRTRNKNK